MNMKKVIAALVAVVVFGVFVWLLIAERGRTSDLTTRLDSAKKAAESEISRLTTLADSRQREIDALTDRNRALEADVATARNETEALKKEYGDFKTESDTLKAEAEKSRAEAEKLKAEVEKLTAEVEELRAVGTEAQNKITELSENEKTLGLNLNVAEARNKSLEREAANLQRYIEMNINKTSEAPQAALECPPCAAAEPPEASLNEEDQAEAASLREEVDRSRAELETLRQRLAEEQARLAAMGEDMSLLDGDRRAAQAEAQSVREANERISADLKNLINSQEVVISQLKDQLSMTFMDKVFFAPGSVTLTPDGSRVLDAVSAALKSLGDKKIVVIGHTDDRPINIRKFPSNWELSTARASAVIRYFQGKGDLAPENLEAVGRAFYDPVAPNDTDENRRKNRRVEIVVGNRLLDEAVARAPESPAAAGALASSSLGGAGLAQNVKIVK